MHHYPRGTVAGVDAHSQYWLLWNISADSTDIPVAIPRHLGVEGADKDGRRTGYTPPCSPPGARHEYTITLYALNSPLIDLPSSNDRQVDWLAITVAMDGMIMASSAISFLN
jgi:phosphatidylethanolamine-binding protein (PEBP) family uncharacterized protein